jgi:hypothetical protein
MLLGVLVADNFGDEVKRAIMPALHRPFPCRQAQSWHRFGYSLRRSGRRSPTPGGAPSGVGSNGEGWLFGAGLFGTVSDQAIITL